MIQDDSAGTKGQFNILLLAQDIARYERPVLSHAEHVFRVKWPRSSSMKDHTQAQKDELLAHLAKLVPERCQEEREEYERRKRSGH